MGKYSLLKSNGTEYLLHRLLRITKRKFNCRDTQANLIETEVDLIEVYVGHGACVEFPLTNRQPLANFNGNLNADNDL